MTTLPNRWLIMGTVLLGMPVLFSAITPYDRLTWLLEVLPVLVAIPLLWLTRRRFPFTMLLYLLIFIHAIILITGGYYSYARVPLGFHIAELLDLDRNPYDKIGHFFQGLVPALIAREIFIRTRCVHGKRMLMFLAVCVALAISASYELIEWAAALILDQDAEEFLGTQGDQWDTQSDMFMALLGALAGIICLSAIHDRQLSHIHQQRMPTQ